MLSKRARRKPGSYLLQRKARTSGVAVLLLVWTLPIIGYLIPNQNCMKSLDQLILFSCLSCIVVIKPFTFSLLSSHSSGF